jgi:hypothetical protein
MPEFSRALDVYQGYDFKIDERTAVGFITSLKLGEKEFTADQACKNPLSPSENLDVVAVLSDVMWETGATDAIYFSGRVSVANKQQTLELVYTTMVNILVEIKFSVYDYDSKEKTYYICFNDAGSAKRGLLEKRGEDLNLSVSDDASSEILRPLNYAFQIGIKPQPEAQVLQLAVGKGSNVTKAWGLKVR